MSDDDATKFADAVRDHCRKEKDAYITELKQLRATAVTISIVADKIVEVTAERDTLRREVGMLLESTCDLKTEIERLQTEYRRHDDILLEREELNFMLDRSNAQRDAISLELDKLRSRLAEVETERDRAEGLNTAFRQASVPNCHDYDPSIRTPLDVDVMCQLIECWRPVVDAAKEWREAGVDPWHESRSLATAVEALYKAEATASERARERAPSSRVDENNLPARLAHVCEGMAASLRKIAAQVDLTNPLDPVGIAMTRAAVHDTTYGPDDVDALLSDEDIRKGG